ncbi:VIR protein [Plasmodium vivax]|uniref:VIR protein n=1 Tax=Plasmodium vivax TaxID=5855 RepID=A0A1G4HA44_PLAVI|nr:VIR protein [Plasmodium vivax]
MDSLEIKDETYDKILKDSHSYSIYNDLNSEDTKEDYKDICDKFNSVGNSSVDNDSKTLCKKIIKNLKNIKNLKDGEHNERCMHYRYWIYHEVKKMLKNESNNKNVNDVLTNFFGMEGEINKKSDYYGCRYFFLHKNIEELKDKMEEKYLYDYFKNHASIKTKQTCVHVTPDEYKKYLNSIKNLFTKHTQDKCCFYGDCPSYINCDDMYNPDKLIAKLASGTNESCDNLEKGDTSLKPGKEATSGSSNENDKIPFYFMNCKFHEKGIYTGCSLVKTQLEDTSKSVNSGTSGKNPNSENSAEGKDTTSPEKEDLRWKLGTRRVPHKSNTGEENAYDVIEYSDELHENKITIRRKDFGTYKLQTGKSESYEAFLENIEKLNFKTDDGNPEGTPNGVTFLGKTIKELDKNNIFNMLNNSYVRFGMSSALGLGIFILLFVYFKFTPLGSCFRNRSSNKYKNNNYFSEEIPTESPPRKTISGNANPQRKSATINYKNNSAGENFQRNSSRENPQRNLSRENSQRNTSRENSQRNTSRGNSQRNTSRGNSRRNTSRENPQRNLSRENSQRNSSRENSQRNSSRENSQRNTSRENSQRNTSRENSQRNTSRENSQRNSSKDNYQSKRLRIAYHPT